RIAQRRRASRRTGLADAAGIFAALDDVNVDPGYFIDAQHAIIVEVRLPHTAALDRNFAPQSRGQAEDQAALQLRGDGVGIDRNPSVDYGGHPAQMPFAIFVNFGLDHGGDETAERRLRADTAAGPRRQRLTPAGFFRDELQRRLQPGRLVEHADTERDRIGHGPCLQFVHEAFGGKDIIVWPDPAPKSGRHRRRLGADIFNLEIRNVVGIVDRAIDRVDVDPVNKYRWRPARHNRRARYAIFPCGNLASRQGCGNHVAIDRPINVVLNVSFARQADFPRPVDLLADAHGGRHHVGFEPTPEASAEE